MKKLLSILAVLLTFASCGACMIIADALGPAF